MDQENQPSIDINSADVEALTQLKGVGKRLAERIIEARPFESVEDLTRVRGISTKDVEKLRPYLTVFVAPDPFEAVEEPIMEEEIEMMTEEEADETAAEAALEETALEESNDDLMEDVSAEVETTLDAAEEEIIEVEEDAASEYFESVTAQVEEMDELEEDGFPVEDEEAELVALETDVEAEPVPEELEPVVDSPIDAPGSQPEAITRGGACGLIFIGGLLTLILSVIVTLGILASINSGQLSYASPYQIAALQSQTESLSVQASTLAEDLDGLRLRIDNLEGLSGRVSEIETEVAVLQDEVVGLQTEVAATQAQYDELVLQIEGIDEQIETLTVQSDRFESFLEGLRALMESLFPEDVETEATP